MGVIHRYIGKKGKYDWEGSIHRDYDHPDVKGAYGKILLSKADGAHNFVFRYFNIAPGGHTILDKHAHDHGVLILHGRAKVILGDKEFEVGPYDVVYVPPFEVHQFFTIGEEPLGFLCVIPPKEKK